MITRLFFHYLARFRVEILLFWAISLASSVASSTGARVEISLGLARLEIVALAWITVRLLLADDGFKTNGGWQARPITLGSMVAAQVVLVGVAITVPLAIRALLLQRMLGLDAEGWELLIDRSWKPQIFTWLMFAVAVKLFGLMILRGLEGRRKAAAWAVLCIAALPCLLLAWGKFRQGRTNYGNGSSNNGPDKLAQGIQSLLPDAKDFIGEWNNISDDRDFPSAKLVLKVPLRSGMALSNGRLLEAEAVTQGVRAAVKIRFTVVDSKLLDELHRAVAILRYADGTCATNRAHVRVRNPSLAPLLSVEEFGFSGVFISPLSLPEFEGSLDELLDGAELMFFTEGPGPALEPEPERIYGMRKEAPRPMLIQVHPGPGREADFENYVHRLVDAFAIQEAHTEDRNLKKLAEQLPREAMPHLLERRPWSRSAWDDLVRPFLMRYATESDIPELKKIIPMDPRVAGLFIAKGWTKEALPQLRALAKERLPLDGASLGALLDEKDPDLAADLASIALRLRDGLGSLEGKLKEQPGFDWPAFVNEGWKRTKYDLSWEGQGSGSLLALWAAREGDAQAFRYIAEKAARGGEEFRWYPDRLKELLGGDQEDAVAYVRAHLEAMKFDAGTKTWSGSP